MYCKIVRKRSIIIILSLGTSTHSGDNAQKYRWGQLECLEIAMMFRNTSGDAQKLC